MLFFARTQGWDAWQRRQRERLRQLNLTSSRDSPAPPPYEFTRRQKTRWGRLVDAIRHAALADGSEDCYRHIIFANYDDRYEFLPGNTKKRLLLQLQPNSTDLNPSEQRRKTLLSRKLHVLRTSTLTNWETTMMVLTNLVPARRQNWVGVKADLKQTCMAI
jgi:hypothetical protein